MLNVVLSETFRRPARQAHLLNEQRERLRGEYTFLKPNGSQRQPTREELAHREAQGSSAWQK